MLQYSQTSFIRSPAICSMSFFKKVNCFAMYSQDISSDLVYSLKGAEGIIIKGWFVVVSGAYFTVFFFYKCYLRFLYSISRFFRRDL